MSLLRFYLWLLKSAAFWTIGLLAWFICFAVVLLLVTLRPSLIWSSSPWWMDLLCVVNPPLRKRCESLGAFDGDPEWWRKVGG